jgi:hypothetical protein
MTMHAIAVGGELMAESGETHETRRLLFRSAEMALPEAQLA